VAMKNLSLKTVFAFFFSVHFSLSDVTIFSWNNYRWLSSDFRKVCLGKMLNCWTSEFVLVDIGSEGNLLMLD
jgi:hypothetical protein